VVRSAARVWDRFATATGARYLAVKSVDRMLDTCAKPSTPRAKSACPSCWRTHGSAESAISVGAEVLAFDGAHADAARPAPDPALVDKLAQ
jgi:hypothetical protein